MSLLKKYEQLASQLGDVTYKLLMLQEKQKELIAQIKNLDEVAGMLNAEKKETKAESSTGGTNSPA